MAEHTRRRIAVIGGGRSDEHDVSLASAAAAVRAVSANGDEVVALTVGRDGRWRGTGREALPTAVAVRHLTACDVALPLLHGVDGEDGAVAGLLTMLGLPFVGSPVRAGALAMDKWATKLLAEAAGIATAPAVLVRRGDDVGAPPLAPPLVVKPTTGGSSNGVTRVATGADFRTAVAAARAAGEDVLVESFVAGREVDIALFRDRDGLLRAGATLEVGVAADGVFDRDRKYDGTAEFTVPARVSPVEHAAVDRAARLLYAALGCSGVARFDFFVTADGIVLNEVNTTPGFTEQSQVPRMYAAVGLPYGDLVTELVEAALAERGAAGSDGTVS
ncbi:ATP-grasp domain-containing protein [Curtobacterium sp. MCBD17_032]|uniref:D-alanine--D-alanine ligase family protein n=1 Tax=Curtobacterium sp. MCBD17_032 TaxID=2175659 RepID=UPI000DA9204F|nr:ATP-grasp domain-containing protein [Curtobacterium sp. MCBD17_032]PZE82160.1 D-alanine--D-alanine ligase [Curtobacterium sp. MCBD17_032]